MAPSPVRSIRDLQKLRTKGSIPKTVFWAIISYCNAVCTTCSFYLVPKSNWRHVSLADARKAVDILHNSDFRMVSITGGEPLMNPDVYEICDCISEKGLIITYLPTNGILVTKQAARRLKDADVRLVGISIDLEDAQGMGLTRKIPNLNQVVMNAKECLDAVGIKTYAGIVLTKSTLDIEKVLETVTRLGFDKVIFSYPQSIQQSSYLASRELEELVLDVKDVEKIVEQIIEVKRDHAVKIHNPAMSLSELVRFYNGAPRRFKCYGGKYLFYLDWDLDLYRCFSLPKKYGNLLDLGKVEDFEEDNGGLCDLCSQQAFRDHDPFYYLASTIKESKDLLFDGHPISSARRFAKEETYHSFKALSEFLFGGFV